MSTRVLTSALVLVLAACGSGTTKSPASVVTPATRAWAIKYEDEIPHYLDVVTAIAPTLDLATDEVANVDIARTFGRDMKIFCALQRSHVRDLIDGPASADVAAPDQWTTMLDDLREAYEDCNTSGIDLDYVRTGQEAAGTFRDLLDTINR